MEITDDPEIRSDTKIKVFNSSFDREHFRNVQITKWSNEGVEAREDHLKAEVRKAVENLAQARLNLERARDEHNRFWEQISTAQAKEKIL